MPSSPASLRRAHRQPHLSLPRLPLGPAPRVVRHARDEPPGTRGGRRSGSQLARARPLSAVAYCDSQGAALTADGRPRHQASHVQDTSSGAAPLGRAESRPHRRQRCRRHGVGTLQLTSGLRLVRRPQGQRRPVRARESLPFRERSRPNARALHAGGESYALAADVLERPAFHVKHQCPARAPPLPALAADLPKTLSAATRPRSSSSHPLGPSRTRAARHVSDSRATSHVLGAWSI